MKAIIIEGVMFVALLAVAVTLVVFVVRHYTAPGRVLEQSRNRRQIERAVSLTCALHAQHDDGQQHHVVHPALEPQREPCLRRHILPVQQTAKQDGIG